MMNVRVKLEQDDSKAALDKVHRYRLRHGNRTEKSKNISESLDQFTWEQHSVDETLQLGNNWDVFQTLGVDVGTTELSDNGAQQQCVAAAGEVAWNAVESIQ